MNKKILFCATVDYHFKAFHLPFLKWLKDQGWEVHIAAFGDIKLPFVDKKYNIPIQRSPLNRKNIFAYKVLKKIIEDNQYRLIHSHTPMGGVLTRLAARSSRGNGMKVLYTAHGFHFCKGSPMTNWILYYPIEKILSRYTDCLLTINEEDYSLAKNHQFRAGIIKHVHGVGVDPDTYSPPNEDEKFEIRREYNYKANQFLMFYAAEFNKNKNQQLLIRTLSILKDELPDIKLLLAGEGPLLEQCKELAIKLQVDEMVDFLGLRTDISNLLKMCDIAIGSSLREGLPVNIMEAMSSGLPVVAIDNRGHRELIHEDINGWIIRNQDVAEFAKRITTLALDQDLRVTMGLNGRKLVLEKYSIHKVLEEMKLIYNSYMNEWEDVMWASH